MAISTLDGTIAGMQPVRLFGKTTVTGTVVVGRPRTLWAQAGNPGAGSYDTTLNGVTLSSTSANVAGQIPFTDPASGNTYLARFHGHNSAESCTMLLLDRIWHNGGFTITSTSAQSITSPTWPARDADGATSGNGVMLMLEISSAAGAASPTITVSYTNQSGTSGRTGTNIDATTNSPAAGSGFRIGLQAGDTGVRSVESLTLSASWVSGTMNLVAYRVLAIIEPVAADVPFSQDVLSGSFTRMYNGSVPYIVFVPNESTAAKITAAALWTQG